MPNLPAMATVCPRSFIKQVQLGAREIDQRRFVVVENVFEQSRLIAEDHPVRWWVKRM